MRVLGWCAFAVTISAQVLLAVVTAPWARPLGILFAIAANFLWLAYAVRRDDSPLVWTNVAFLMVNLSGALGVLLR